MWHSPKTWVTHRVPDSRLANHHEPAAAVSRRRSSISVTIARTIATQHAIALRRRLQTIDPAAPADLLDGNAWHAYLEEHR